MIDDLERGERSSQPQAEWVGDFGIHEVCFICQRNSSEHDLMMRQMSGDNDNNNDLLIRARSVSSNAEPGLLR